MSVQVLGAPVEMSKFRGTVRVLVHGTGSLGGVVVVLVVTEVLTRLEFLPSRFLPPPTIVFATLGAELETPTPWLAMLDTMRGWAFGLGIATLIALPLGILLGLNELAFRALRPVIEFLRPVPSVALVPLVFLMFAYNLGDGKIFLAAFASTWPLLIGTIYGVRNVLPVQLDTARSFHIRSIDIARKVVLPASLPYIATGMRVASTVALILVLTGEIVINAGGIGSQINAARQGSAVALMYSYVILAGVLGILVNIVFQSIERRLLHWHPSNRTVTS